MPLDTIQFAKRVLIALTLLSLTLLLGFLVWTSAQMLLLIFAGTLFAVFVRGIADFLFGRLPLPEKAGILCTLLLLSALLVVFFILLVPQLLAQGEQLVKQLPEALALLQEKVGQFGMSRELLEKTSESFSLKASGEITRRAMGLFATTLGALTSVFIILFVGLYLAFSPEYYRQGLLHLVPGQARRRTEQVLKALVHNLALWLIGRFVSMLIISVLTFLGLLFLDIPLALSLATLAGLLTFIPYIGPVISAIPAILLGFTVSPMTAVYTALLYAILQVIESYMVSPLIQKHQVSLPPVLTLSSQVVLGSTQGLLGIALATPLTVVALVLVKLLYVEQVLGYEAGVKGVENKD